MFFATRHAAVHVADQAQPLAIQFADAIVDQERAKDHVGSHSQVQVVERDLLGFARPGRRTVGPRALPRRLRRRLGRRLCLDCGNLLGGQSRGLLRHVLLGRRLFGYSGKRRRYDRFRASAGNRLVPAAGTAASPASVSDVSHKSVCWLMASLSRSCVASTRYKAQTRWSGPTYGST